MSATRCRRHANEMWILKRPLRHSMYSCERSQKALATRISRQSCKKYNKERKHERFAWSFAKNSAGLAFDFCLSPVLRLVTGSAGSAENSAYARAHAGRRDAEAGYA